MAATVAESGLQNAPAGVKPAGLQVVAMMQRGGTVSKSSTSKVKPRHADEGLPVVAAIVETLCIAG